MRRKVLYFDFYQAALTPFLQVVRFVRNAKCSRSAWSE
jgi:hypothetical protein